MFRNICFCVFLMLISCSAFRPRLTPEQELRKRYFSHTVQYPGESLSLIAEWYTGSAKNWEKILTHNANIQVKRLRIGQTIDIPREMLIKTDPLPKTLFNKNPTKPKSGQNPQLKGSSTTSQQPVKHKATPLATLSPVQEPTQERTKRRDDLLDELLRE